MNKGQIAQVVLWGASIVASGAMAFSGYVSNKVNAIEKQARDDNTAIVQRVSTTETENKQFRDDIKEIKMILKELNAKIK